MTLLKKMIRDQLLGPNYDTIIPPLIAKHEALKIEREQKTISLKPVFLEMERLITERKIFGEDIQNGNILMIKGSRPVLSSISPEIKAEFQQKVAAALKIWETSYTKTIGPNGKSAYTDGTYFYQPRTELDIRIGGDIDNLSYKFVGETNLETYDTSLPITMSATYGDMFNSRGDYIRSFGQSVNSPMPCKFIDKGKLIEASKIFGLKASNGGFLIYPSEPVPSLFSMIPTAYKGVQAWHFLNSFNFLLSVVNHYERYQTTGLLFTNPNDRDVQTSILSGNVLKALTSQARFLVPNGQNLINYNSTLAGQAGINPILGQFIWVCTMGYLKSGDIIVSTLQKYFSSSETYVQVVERMRAMGTNQTSDGFFTPPPFLFNMMGTDWNVTSMPTGKMVLKVIRDCLIEAEAFYKIIFPSKKQ